MAIHGWLVSTRKLIITNLKIK